MSAERDDALEEAAQAIEHPDFAELCGVLSRTKKGQREYEIRRKTIADTKRRMADYIRSLKSGQGNDIRTALVRMANRGDNPIYDTRDMWQMADLGWLHIFVTVKATDNSIPPRAEYRIELTNRGKRVLAEFNEVPDPA